MDKSVEGGYVGAPDNGEGKWKTEGEEEKRRQGSREAEAQSEAGDRVVVSRDEAPGRYQPKVGSGAMIFRDFTHLGLGFQG